MRHTDGILIRRMLCGPIGSAKPSPTTSSSQPSPGGSQAVTAPNVRDGHILPQGRTIPPALLPEALPSPSRGASGLSADNSHEESMHYV